MIIQNKRTMKKLSLSQKEFFEKYYNEIQEALLAYIKIEQDKKLYLKRNKAELENDFYFNMVTDNILQEYKNFISLLEGMKNGCVG